MPSPSQVLMQASGASCMPPTMETDMQKDAEMAHHDIMIDEGFRQDKMSLETTLGGFMEHDHYRRVRRLLGSEGKGRRLSERRLKEINQDLKRRLDVMMAGELNGGAINEMITNTGPTDPASGMNLKQMKKLKGVHESMKNACEHKKHDLEETLAGHGAVGEINYLTDAAAPEHEMMDEYHDMERIMTNCEQASTLLDRVETALDTLETAAKDPNANAISGATMKTLPAS